MTAPLDIVCCSLEPWDEVWRRNQFFVRELVGSAGTRLLFVEPPTDVLWTVRSQRRLPALRSTRPVEGYPALWATSPRKWLPRKLWSRTDHMLGSHVIRAAHHLGMTAPVLWINDSTYAALPGRTGWPAVYDITDDWLLAEDVSERELARQRGHDAALVADARAVVVCSPALERDRGATRAVHLIPNGVDLDHFRTPQPRPDDLPAGPYVLYVGTLASGRLDLALCLRLTEHLRGRAEVVFVGPNSLSAEDDAALRDAGAQLLGARPYPRVPAYLQHADVLVVPHLVTPFTESLDPIKAREILAVARPTVSTPVAGFRDLGPPVAAVPAEGFVQAVDRALAVGAPAGAGPLAGPVGSWTDRGAEFRAVLERAASRPGSAPAPAPRSG